MIQHNHKMVIAGDLSEMCERFNPYLLGIVTVTDILIFSAYVSFAVCLALGWKFIKPHFPKMQIIWFGLCAFVASCGIQHLLRTIGLWRAGYWWYLEAYWSIWVSVVSLFTAYIVFATYRKLKKARSLRLALAITANVLKPKTLSEQLEDARKMQSLINEMRGNN